MKQQHEEEQKRLIESEKLQRAMIMSINTNINAAKSNQPSSSADQ